MTTTTERTRLLTTASTLREFRNRSERLFRNGNPDARSGLTIAWEWSRRVTFPTGLKGFTGSFTATADGFRTKAVLASWAEGTGLMVR
jgi:hypothetical protein